MLVAAARAHAQSPEQPPAHLSLADDLLVAIGGRPIEGRRIETLVATGSDATHQAALRATDRFGSLHFELTGGLFSSDVLAGQSDAAARIEHHGERDVIRTYGSYATGHAPATLRTFTTDSDAASYGASWSGWRSAGRFELEATGEHLDLRDERSASALDLATTRYTARAELTSNRILSLGLDHELGAGISIVRASGVAGEGDFDPAMPTQVPALHQNRRGNHRFLSAYLHDTIRVIESLDISGGFVFEQWRWLSTMQPLSQLDEMEMDLEAPEVIGSLIGPQLHAMYRITPKLGLTAHAYRRLRTPSWQQLMRPVEDGGVRTIPNRDLRSATVTGAEVGSVISTDSIEAHATAYWREVDDPLADVTVDEALRETTNLDHARELGISATASWRIAKPWLAGISYTFTNARVTEAESLPYLAGKQLAQTPRHRATAMVAFDDPRILTVTGVVRYVGQRFEDDRNTAVAEPFAVIDAMATRRITHGLAGFIAVENLLDRRYVEHLAGFDQLGAPRIVHVGLRLDSARW